MSSSMPNPAQIQSFLTTHAITIHAPPTYAPLTPIITFSQLSFTTIPIPPKLRSAVAGFKEPTPIQACTWPPALKGQDVVGIAETGSGKTLAFGIPALARLLDSPPILDLNKLKMSTITVLVVAPTRELALQTHDTLSALGKPFGVASVAIFGGVDKGPQIKSLASANKDGMVTRIVVGTPGRILDLVNDGACDLSRSVCLIAVFVSKCAANECDFQS
jgi:ATP-dependent RNA helicase DBP3